MERVEFRKNISHSLTNLRQSGLQTVSLSETKRGCYGGRNSVIYHLSVKTNDKPIELRLDHIWGDACAELFTLWYEIKRFDSSVLTENKGRVLQVLWKSTYPDSNFMLARSSDADLIIGTKLNIEEFNPDKLVELISTLVESIPHAEKLTKTYLGYKKHPQTLERATT
ncbi:hypothetical protein A2W13_00900 [Candidatus Woesebacteria bacterium RBG_16_36_11]|uniref:Uncharacterized protein n=3 Tax=Candidatus Woeseibacteriota TaxID=1752722 RepID=A0A1F7X8G4_9BACT|nr:MAG: hypothetical protein A2Z67_00575 [Candidatus Woesebacteria bacterium RBG_13_36_22]OGM11271.1 MAG: hypothetical protein A2W13_00900 [Candidatus Woesebacteria bacterium RBG_16_36_11]OGM17519.1 MAG: hypothetical protein A2V55_02630 [Candidatus Woesebacteria bacterium RBG_19FT_COMBO_37_29]